MIVACKQCSHLAISQSFQVLQIQPNVLLRPKTTMRIGGTAQYFAEVKTREELEEATAFAHEKNISLIPLGSGSNTIFADGEIKALVIQLKNEAVAVEENRITVGAGKNLPMFVNECAKQGLDLSALTGIPGTIGGAIFGNAGQGPKGIWIDSFVESVTVYDGEWKTVSRNQCEFGYRESRFKAPSPNPSPATGAGNVVQKVSLPSPVVGEEPRERAIIWEVALIIPKADPVTIKTTIDTLLQKRIETQPHARTAGSCFKAVGEMPAWQLIDAVGLRGYKVGDIEISTKHANFLISGKEPKFSDVMQLIATVKEKIPQGLEVEMRCIGEDGLVVV